MPTPRLSRDVAQKRYGLIEGFLREGHPPPGRAGTSGILGAITEAAIADGKSKNAARSWFDAARSVIGHDPDWSLYPGAKPKDDKIEFPTFADDDISAEEILDHMEKRFQQRVKHAESLHWFEIGVKSDEPVGLAVVGDPHMGSNGCNVTLLRRDVDLMKNTPGVGAVNIGDTADNWGGRLVQLYAENDVSRQTERRISRWFLQDSGIPWWLWLKGNHDSMDGEFSTYLTAINASVVPMLDWEAKFVLKFPSRDVRCSFAHNHKGTSIYNPLHGQKREALWGEDADLYVAGHHHTAAQAVEELQDGRLVTMARVRGYKWLDDHATIHGFRNNEHGATQLFVINPKAESPTDLITGFMDLKRGCDYLTYLRAS